MRYADYYIATFDNKTQVCLCMHLWMSFVSLCHSVIVIGIEDNLCCFQLSGMNVMCCGGYSEEETIQEKIQVLLTYVVTFFGDMCDNIILNQWLIEFSQSVSVTDMHMEATSPPLDDTLFGCHNNVILPPYAASQVDGIMTYSFCRLLDTGDDLCDKKIVLDEEILVMCAHGTSNDVITFFSFIYFFCPLPFYIFLSLFVHNSFYPQHALTILDQFAYHGSLFRSYLFYKFSTSQFPDTDDNIVSEVTLPFSFILICVRNCICDTVWSASLLNSLRNRFDLS